MKDPKINKCCNEHTSCAETIDTKCVPIVGIEYPQWSDLKNEKCVVLEDIIQDVYDKLNEVVESIDLKDIGTYCKSCIDYNVEDMKELPVNKAIFALERKICSIDN